MDAANVESKLEYDLQTQVQLRELAKLTGAAQLEQKTWDTKIEDKEKVRMNLSLQARTKEPAQANMEKKKMLAQADKQSRIVLAEARPAPRLNGPIRCFIGEHARSPASCSTNETGGGHI